MKNLFKYLLMGAASLCTLFTACKPEEAPAEHYINVTPTSISTSCAGESFDIAVEANCMWTVEKSGAEGDLVDWITYGLVNAEGNAHFQLTVKKNPIADARTAKVIVKSAQTSVEIAVSQEGDPNYVPPQPEPEPDPDQPVGGDMVLTFDFTGKALDGWPTDKKAGVRYDMMCSYPINGVDYKFHLVEAPGVNENTAGADGGRLWWRNDGLFLIDAVYRYLGVPAIEGYCVKTIEVKVAKQVAKAASYITDRVAPIVRDDAGKALADQCRAEQISPAQSWNVPEGTVLTYEVNSKDPGKMYYIFCHSTNAAMSEIKVTYTPAASTQKVLEFDFTGEALDGWPTALKSGERRDMLCDYPLDGVNYQFHLVESPGADENTAGASGGQVFWKNKEFFLIYSIYRYLGFPVIDGWALKTVYCTVGKEVDGNPSSYVTDRVAPIVRDDAGKPIADKCVPPQVAPIQSWEVPAGTVLTYEVNSTESLQRYYLFCAIRNAAMSHLKLVYVQE